MTGTNVVEASPYSAAVSCCDSELHRQYWSCRIMTPCATCPSLRSATVSWLAKLWTAADSRKQVAMHRVQKHVHVQFMVGCAKGIGRV